MKHAYAELFTAKLNDVSLVLFEKHEEWKEWREATKSDLVFAVGVNFDYFLCIPQHKEACLHWLNGGDVQAVHFENQMPDSGVMLDSDFVDLEDDVFTYSWKDNHIFMQEHEITIKPKKEKRWIGYCASRNQTIPHPQDSGQLAMDYAALHYSYHVNEWQFIEIEVEVAG